MRYLDDPALPIHNNHDEQQIRTWALGRANWLFAGSLRASKHAAAITSLIRSAKLNGYDPYVYLKGVLTRLPTQKQRYIDQVLPHRKQPLSKTGKGEQACVRRALKSHGLRYEHNADRALARHNLIAGPN